MTDPGNTESAKRAQAGAEAMGMNEDDEAQAEQKRRRSGEPQRDSAGKEEGSS